MNTNNQTVIIGLLALIVGLMLGYFFGANTMPHREFFRGGWMGEEMHEEMEEEMEEHMYGDEIIDSDGAMQHMMEEMMLVGRGKHGAAYEEAWLRGMIVHHLGAIAVSEQLLEETDRPELENLANSIIESQSAEVEMMKGWLGTWFSGNSYE